MSLVLVFEILPYLYADFATCMVNQTGIQITAWQTVIGSCHVVSVVWPTAATVHLLWLTVKVLLLFLNIQTPSCTPSECYTLLCSFALWKKQNKNVYCVSERDVRHVRWKGQMHSGVLQNNRKSVIALFGALVWPAQRHSQHLELHRRLGPTTHGGNTTLDAWLLQLPSKPHSLKSRLRQISNDKHNKHISYIKCDLLFKT